MGQADQAYVYVTDSQADWIGRLLTSQPELKQQPLSILALPGAHDAGMFRGLDTDEAARDLVDGLVGRYVSKEALAAALAGGYLVAGAVSLLMPVMHLIAGLLIALRTTSMARRALINFSYTQKDDITTQLLLGTRFFDFRPGYNASFFRRDQELRHQHGFIPGYEFSGFLLLNDFSDNALTDCAASITLQRLASRLGGKGLAEGPQGVGRGVVAQDRDLIGGPRPEGAGPAVIAAVSFQSCPPSTASCGASGCRAAAPCRAGPWSRRSAGRSGPTPGP